MVYSSYLILFYDLNVTFLVIWTHYINKVSIYTKSAHQRLIVVDKITKDNSIITAQVV